MSHLTPDELIDAVEAALAAPRRAHLHDCPSCAQEVRQLAAILGESRVVDVPDPSPLFWDRFADQVRQAIATDAGASRFAHWFEWRVLAPVAGLALLVFALASAVPHGRIDLQQARAIAAPADRGDDVDPSAALDQSWAIVSELVGELDVEAAQQAGIGVAPGTADGVALQLSSAETQELVRLLRAELQRAGG